MRYRVLQIGGLVGGLVTASAAAAAVVGRKKLLSSHNPSPSSSASTDQMIQPPEPSGVSWDFNWDRMSPESVVRPPKPGASLEEYENKLNEARGTAVRNLLLVRHGQYQEGAKQKWLTPLGREQAELAGKYLQSLNLPVNKIIWSTKNRATETGKIISKYFTDVPTEGCQLLEEGAPPVAPEPQNPAWIPPASDIFIQGAQMEAAFRKHFHRAKSSQKEDSYEIVSCHGNVIRYCVLRALQLPPEAWLNLSAYNASITWVRIAPDGTVSLLTFGNTGFIPPDKITYMLNVVD